MNPRLTPALLALLVLSASIASANTLTVVEVHPGCVIEFEDDWKTRLTGVIVADPESDAGRQASEYCASRLEGELIALFTWTKRDRNRISGVVFDGEGNAFGRILYGPDRDRDIAAELLELGLAWVDTAQLPANLEHHRQIEQKATEAEVGVWAQE